MKDIIKNFSNCNILVLGDIMLDEFLFGNVERINPEAPVPVLHVKKTLYKPGGAANVASNIVSLGGKCTLIGRVGNDSTKKILEDLFQDINYEFIVEDIPTIRKTRCMAKNQQLLRVDYEKTPSLESKNIPKIIEYIKTQNPNLIIASDYAKGFFTKELVGELKKLNIKIIGDIKPKHKEWFKDIFLITPNMKEGKEMSNLSDPLEIGNKLKQDMNCNILLTRSEDGMTLFSNEIYHIPTKALEVYDVTGAGDTVVASLALSLASGATLKQSASISNHAAGIVVGKIGTATTTQKELINRFDIENSKIKDFDEIKEIVDDLRLKDKKIGLFYFNQDNINIDIIKKIREAKNKVDYLIIAIKNYSQDFADILSSLEKVNYVIKFEMSLNQILQPDEVFEQ